MKLTVLGGGGVRLPLLIRGLIREGNGGTFDRVTLFDIEEERLTVMGQLAQHLLREASSSIQLDYTTDLREALQGTDFVLAPSAWGEARAASLTSESRCATGWWDKKRPAPVVSPWRCAPSPLC